MTSRPSANGYWNLLGNGSEAMDKSEKDYTVYEPNKDYEPMSAGDILDCARQIRANSVDSAAKEYVAQEFFGGRSTLDGLGVFVIEADYDTIQALHEEDSPEFTELAHVFVYVEVQMEPFFAPQLKRRFDADWAFEKDTERYVFGIVERATGRLLPEHGVHTGTLSVDTVKAMMAIAKRLSSEQPFRYSNEPAEA